MTAKHTYVNERVALLYGIEQRQGRPLSARRARRFDALGLARQGRDPDGGGVSEPHVAGAARRVHSREHRRARRPRRRRRASKRSPRTKIGTAKARTVREMIAQAPRESDVLRLPRRHGSARLRARELRRRRRVARARPLCGRRRSTPRASLPDGTRLHGPDDLREALLRRPEQFVQTFTERLMTYALGRTLDYEDMPAVRKIVRDAASEDYRFSAIVRGRSWRASRSSMRQVRGDSTAQSTVASSDGKYGERHMFITKKHLSRRRCSRARAPRLRCRCSMR